jgi:hypothetical protein
MQGPAQGFRHAQEIEIPMGIQPGFTAQVQGMEHLGVLDFLSSKINEVLGQPLVAKAMGERLQKMLDQDLFERHELLMKIAGVKLIVAKPLFVAELPVNSRVSQGSDELRNKTLREVDG